MYCVKIYFFNKKRNKLKQRFIIRYLGFIIVKRMEFENREYNLFKGFQVLDKRNLQRKVKKENVYWKYCLQRISLDSFNIELLNY